MNSLLNIRRAWPREKGHCDHRGFGRDFFRQRTGQIVMHCAGCGGPVRRNVSSHSPS